MPLTRLHKDSLRNRRWMFALAIVLLIAGGVALVIGSHDALIRGIGVALCLASTYLIRSSGEHREERARGPGVFEADKATSSRPGQLSWIIGIALVIVMGISYEFMFRDSQHGSHHLWPVCLFAIASIACALMWGYLMTKML